MDSDIRNNKPVKTAAFFPADKFGCGYYRCMLPSISLCRMGIPAHIMTIDRINLYSIADSLILQRPAEASMLNLIEEAHTSGVKTIFEIDDNIWELPVWNQAYPFWTPIRQKFCSDILEAADMAVVSTEYLADVVRQMNPNVVVVPNAIFDNNTLDLPIHTKDNEDSILIGWIGSSFHLLDTKIFRSLIPAILDKYSNVKFLMMGEHPPRELASYLHRIVALPFVDPIYYHQILNSYTIDIGLAPLVDCEFNKSKSAIKMIEYLYTNTFPICSDIEPYKKLNQACGDNFILLPTSTEAAGTVDDWMDAIDYSIKNISEIKRKTQIGREYIMENHNIESDKLKELYKKTYF